jgi:HEAT repeat protein
MIVLAGVLLLGSVAAEQPEAVRPIPPVEKEAPAPLQPAQRAPADEGEVRESVEALLGSRAAVSPERWRRLGPRALPVLESIAGDPKALPTRRARAVEGLVALGSSRAPSLLTRLAQSDDEPFVVRLAAVRGAGRALSAPRRLSALRPVLEKAPDAHLRAAAAEVLARHPSGCEAVRAQADRESGAARSKFAAALRRCNPE